jgi:hypothetical protein
MKNRLFRITSVAEIEPSPEPLYGTFVVEENDPMVGLANTAPASFTPVE